MKIILDPVYSTYPSRCSSAAKCQKLVQTFQERGRTDVWFYWLYPAWLEHGYDGWETEKAWFATMPPNVTFIPIPMVKDRMREYTKFTKEMDDVFAFNGNWWDYDAVFTSRTSMIPLMRSVMNSPRTKKHGRSLRTIVNFEEMALMSYRPTVALSDTESQELMTCAGYLAADKVMMMTPAERKSTMDTVKQYLAPSRAKKVSDHICLASQVMFDLDELQLKAPEHRFKRGTRPFVLSFTGRLEASASNLETVYASMTNQFIWRGADMKLLICTVSPSAAGQWEPPDFVEVRHPQRKEFWHTIRTEMDVVLALHNQAEFSLSIVEPMLLGTPVILNDQKWSRDIFGDEYPFYAKGMTQAYGWVKALYDNYDKYYEIWTAYHQNVLIPMFSPGGQYGISMYDVIYEHFSSFDEKQKEYVLEWFQQKAIGIPKQIAEFVKERQSFVLFDVIKEMGCFEILQRKIQPGDRDERRITFSTDWQEMRVALKYFYGWKDGKKVGEFVR